MMLELIFTLIILFAFFAMCLWFGKAVWNSGEALSLVADDRMRENCMSEQPDWQAIEADLREQFGQALRVTWTLQRPLQNIDDRSGDEPQMGTTETELMIEVQPELLATNPTIILIAGTRRFRVIEEREGEMDDGLFRERRRNGAAHQGL
jgi:hypothetical protein